MTTGSDKLGARLIMIGGLLLGIHLVSRIACAPDAEPTGEREAATPDPPNFSPSEGQPRVRIDLAPGESTPRIAFGKPYDGFLRGWTPPSACVDGVLNNVHLFTDCPGNEGDTGAPREVIRGEGLKWISFTARDEPVSLTVYKDFRERRTPLRVSEKPHRMQLVPGYTFSVETSYQEKFRTVSLTPEQGCILTHCRRESTRTCAPETITVDLTCVRSPLLVTTLEATPTPIQVELK